MRDTERLRKVWKPVMQLYQPSLLRAMMHGFGLRCRVAVRRGAKMRLHYTRDDVVSLKDAGAIL
jgi:hypothetical protein